MTSTPTVPATPGPTIDQRRARHAWDAVARVRNNPKRPSGSSYAREAKRLPVRILTAGLGHALAFLNAKAGPGRESANVLLLRDVADWVLDKRDNPGSSAERPLSRALIEKIVAGDATFLRFATDEVLAYLQWLTRFAEAEFGADEEN